VLVQQSELRPGEILRAIESLVGHDTTGIRIASAYITTGGLNLLLPRLKALVGAAWGGITKEVVTSFDYGFTDHLALGRLLADPDGYSVRVAKGDEVIARGLSPRVSFHPKVYVVNRSADSGLYVGSSNLTDPGFTLNTEVGFAVASVPTAMVDAIWAEVYGPAQPLTPQLLAQYASLRTLTVRRRARQALPPVTTAVLPATATTTSVAPLGSAVDTGFDPATFDHFWVEIGGPSGGSGNQLELPRTSNRFFGFTYATYDRVQRDIGTVPLLADLKSWAGQRLVWFGHNQMERFYLPTIRQGGSTYRPEKVVLFRREPLGYRFLLADRGSPEAIAWLNASQRLATTFRVGDRTDRLCGFFR
jgi:HKD family nuclease